MITKSFVKLTYSGASCLMLLLSLIIIGSLSPVHAENDPLDEVPLLETSQFELLATDSSGQLQLTIKASQMCQYQNGDVILVGDIEIVIVDHKGDQQEEGPTHIKANKLSYNKAQSLAVIEGDVLVNKPQKALTIRSEQLCYDMKEETIFTNLPIVVTHKADVLKGGGLRATRDFTKYTVTGPNGTVEITQPPVLGA